MSLLLLCLSLRGLHDLLLADPVDRCYLLTQTFVCLIGAKTLSDYINIDRFGGLSSARSSWVGLPITAGLRRSWWPLEAVMKHQNANLGASLAIEEETKKFKMLCDKDIKQHHSLKIVIAYVMQTLGLQYDVECACSLGDMRIVCRH